MSSTNISVAEYAVLAAAAYNDNRGLDNKIPASSLPPGWIQSVIPGLNPSDTSSNPLGSGFSASTFVNGSNVVISFEGTDFLTDPGEGQNVGQTLSDGASDLALGAGLGSQQLIEAALLYEKVKAEYPADKGFTITFTGHSLGAGLASVMSVWFNRSATIFADAPFMATAQNTRYAATVAAELALSGTVDPDLLKFLSYAPLSLGVSDLAGVLARESLVIAYYVQGEVLNKTFGWAGNLGPLGTVVGTGQNIAIPVGGGDAVGAVTLHSIVLHALLEMSAQFGEDTIEFPTLLSALFNPALYARPLQAGDPDFITELLNASSPCIGTPNFSTSALSLFAEDLKKLVTPGGPQAQSNTLISAVIAATIEDYYWQMFPDAQPNATYKGLAVTPFLNAVKDGVNFNPNNATAIANGKPQVSTQLNLAVDVLANNDSMAANIIASAQNWYVQAGSDGMTASGKDSTGNDVLIGGGYGNDLIGGNGNNVLIAGTGYDTLKGGAGAGMNYFQAGFSGDLLDGYSTFVDKYEIVADGGTTGSDTIDDQTGMGTVWIGDTQLIGATGAVNNNTWTASDGTTYKFAPNVAGSLQQIGTLTITNGTIGKDDELVIDNFDLAKAESTVGGGFLGITFKEQTAIEAGNASNPFASSGTVSNTSASAAGSEQSITIYASVVSDAAQTVTLKLTGASASLFNLNTDAGLMKFSGDSVTLTIPAGADSVTFGLVYTGDPTQAPTVQLSSIFGNGGSGGTSPASNTLALTFNPAPPPPTPGDVITGVTTLNGQPLNYTLYNGDGGDDLITTDSGPNLIQGAGGNDSIAAGSGNDTINAGSGNSTISGGGGQDIILLGDGSNQVYVGSVVTLNDALNQSQTGSGSGAKGTFIGVGDGNNTIVGGNGNDAIFVGTGDNTIICGPGSVSLEGGVEAYDVSSNWYTTNTPGLVTFSNVGSYSAPFDAPAGYEGAMNSDGTPMGTGNDTIFGGKGDSFFWLANGDNYLDAGGGNDQIQASTGSSTIFGGSGNDSIYSGGGNNYIDGESGNDLIVGEGGDITVFGGTGNDSIYSGDDGTDWATSQKGNGYLEAGSGNTQMAGAGGNDTLIGGSGSDTLFAGDGNEYLQAGSGNTTLVGGAGSDTLIAGSGNDSFNGGSGDETIVGGSGVDTIWGGAGNDVISAGDGGTGTSQTEVTAGTGNTTITGGAGVDYINGGAGTNVLYAGDGGDDAAFTQVVAGAGNTTIYGGAGVDHIFGGAGTNVLYAGDGGDDTQATQVTAGTGSTTIYGGAGVDHIFGGAKTDVIYAGDGGDNTAATEVTAGAGNTTIYGGGGVDSLEGGSGSDMIYAGDGTANLIVGSGTDTLVAGSGINNFYGGATTYIFVGNTEIGIGGLGGTATYIINSDSGNTTIVDSSAGDTLQFGDGISIADITASQAVNENIGSLTVTYSTILTLDNGSTVTINGGSLSQASFADGSVASFTQLLSPTFAVGNTTFSSANGTLGAVTIAPGTTAPTQSLTLLGTGNLTGIGNNANNVIHANKGNDILIAGSANDTLIGGGGEDVYVVSAGLGTVTTINNSSSADTLSFSAGVTLADLSISTAAAADGSLIVTLQNSLGGSIVINGGSGGSLLDQISFADGSVASLGQMLAPLTNGPTAATSATSVDLAAGIENMTLTGTANISATGNAKADVITANSGNDTLIAGSGDDILVGGGGTVVYDVAAGDNVVIANSSSTDILAFGANINAINLNTSTAVVNGSTVVTITDNLGGQVVIDGGALSQVSFLDGSTATLSQLLAPSYTEGATEYSTVSATAGAGITTLAMLGNGNLEAIGNNLNDTLVANRGNDTLLAGSGNDTLMGGGNSDTYVISSGAQTTVIEQSSVFDTLSFGSGVSLANLSATAATATDGTTSITVQNSLGGSVVINAGYYGQLDQISFADGSSASLGALLAQATTGITAATSAVSVTLTEGIQNMILTGSANLSATGNDQDDVITVNSGNDTLIAGSANDTLNGGAGSTTYVVNAGSGAATIANSGNLDSLLFGAGISRLDLTASSTEVNGVSVVAVSDTQGGQVVIQGGALSQVNFADGSSTTVSALLAGEFSSAVSFVMPGNASILNLTGSASISGTGNSAADIITANSGNDTLIAGSGLATLVGGSGNDTFVINNVGDVITEQANSGNNTVDTSVSYVLPGNIQNITGTGSGNISLTGNNLADVITANSGNDTLIAGTGNDTLVGAALAAQGSSGQVVTYQINAGAGNATILDSQLGLATGDKLQFGTGINASDVTSSFATGSNGVENLTLQISDGASVEIAGATAPVYTANFSDGSYSTFALNAVGEIQSNYAVVGNAGTTVLASDSWSDADGSHGTDIFNQDGSRSGTVYSADGGVGSYTDTGVSALTSASYTSSAGDTSLTGTGYANLILTGNALNDVITANSGNDQLIGGSGADTLIAGSGNDTLIGGDLRNVYVVGSGAVTTIEQSGNNDVLSFGTGISAVDMSATAADGADGSTVITIQNSLGGAVVIDVGNANPLDQVNFANGSTASLSEILAQATTGITAATSAVSVNLDGGIQNMTLTGTADISAYGNAQANVITANSGNDEIDAGSGNTTIYGGSGVDSLFGGSGNDVLYTGDGGSADAATQVGAGNGNTTVYGGNGIDNIFGGSGLDVLNAGDGGTAANATTVIGGSGNDTLVASNGTADFFGGAGAATYLINSGNGNTNIWNSLASDTLQFGAAVTIGDVVTSEVSYTNGSAVILTLAGGGSVTVEDGGVDQARFADGSVVSFAQLLAPTFVIGNTTYASVNASLAAAAPGATQNLTLIGNADLSATGNNVNNVISANNGNDTLIAGTANDTLVGGGTSDVYVVSAGGGTTTTIEQSGAADTLSFGGSLGIANLSATAASDGHGSTITAIQDSLGGVVVLDTSGNANGLLDKLDFADGSTASLSALLAQATTGITAATSAVSVTLAAGIQNMSLTGTANISAAGNAQDNVITANSGNDTLIAGSGDDTLYGGGGTATYVFNQGDSNVVIANSGSADKLVFGAGIGEANLSTSSATINGSMVVTIADNQGGLVTIQGGALNQVNFADGSTASLSQLLAPSYTVGSATYSKVSATAGTGVSTLTMTGSANVTATGNSINDTITANSGNDTLVAGSASDTLIGGGASDVYTVSAATGTVTTINNSHSTDTLNFASGVSLANLSVKTATAANGALIATLQNSLGGSVVINADVLGNLLDKISFSGGGTASLGQMLAQLTTGPTAASSAVSVTLAAGIQNMTLTGAANISATSNALDDVITANGGNDTLIAGSGNDTLNGGSGATTYVVNPAGGNVVIAHSGSADTLLFGSGIGESNLTTSSAVVNGVTVVTIANSHGGTVTIQGGSLNQVNFADGSSATLSQLLSPSYTKGTTTYSTVSTTAGLGIVTLDMTGSANVTATANTLNDVISANSGSDTLVAGTGNDTLIGGGKADVYVINASSSTSIVTTIEQSGLADTLSYGSGVSLADLSAMAASGAAGSTVITLQDSVGGSVAIDTSGNTNASLDKISFADGSSASLGQLLAQATSGITAASSAVSVKLGKGIQNMDLIGSGNLTATGNNLDDIIFANDGNDTLIAGSGDDTLYGGAGADSLVAGSGNDSINAGSGNTTIVGGSGVDTLFGGDGNDVLYAGSGGNATAVTEVGAGNGNTTIYGGSGIDNIFGGSGADLFYAGSGGTAANATSVIGGSGNDTLVAGAGIADLFGGAGTATYLVNSNSTGNTNIWNSVADDTLQFGAGITIANISGSEVVYQNGTAVTFTLNTGGSITINEGGLSKVSFADGSTTTVSALLAAAGMSSAVSVVMSAGATRLTLTGSASISGTGNNLADTIIANSGNDTLIAGSGLATLIGGSGNDTFVINNVNDVITEAANNGSNTEQTSVSATLAANVQKLTATGSAALTLTGNALVNTITANSGADTLVAGSGVATLVGGSGNDTFVINNAADVITKAANSGSNLEQTSVSTTLATNVQKLTATGTAALTLTGNALANTITANSGADTLVAGSGIATLVGGSGNDTFVINNASDLITEAANTGNNTEQTTVSVTLATNVQNLTGIGSAALTLTGNTLNDVITANTGADKLTAGSGIDTLISGTGIDTLIGGTGNDTFVVNNAADVITKATNTGSNVEQTSVSVTLAANIQKLTGIGTAALTLTGGTSANTITANSGADTLVAGTGIATLVGGSGNDTFVINNASDVITEAANSGSNAEQTSISATLAANVQNLTGTGSAALTLTGNALNNVITANTGANKLVAGSGSDTLVSGTGIDTLVGGAGNDTFVINNASDVITEAANSGSNTEQTSVSLTLAANVQNLMGTGSAALTLTGNTLANVITGNSGNDTLIAGSGNDTLVAGSGTDSMTGGAGSDSYQLSNGADHITLGSGVSNVSGVNGNYQIVGSSNNSNDSITLGTGTDTLSLGNGSDTLINNGGADTATLGSGQYGIINTGGTESLILSSVSSANDLWFRQSSEDLLMSVLGSTESIDVHNWFLTSGPSTTTTKIALSGGTAVTDAGILQLVQAMAAFTPPTSAQLSYTTAEQTALAPVIAANWH